MSLLKRLEKNSSQIRDSRNLPFAEFHRFVRAKVYGAISPPEIISALKTNPSRVREELKNLTLQIIEEEKRLLAKIEKEKIVNYILNEILGYGPIEPLLQDSTITEIMVNGPYQVYIEREGKIEETPIVFEDSEHVMKVIDKIVSPLGRRVDESSPMVNARLPDGSRVNAVIPPLALNGPTLTIRKFRPTVFTLDEMVEMGSLNADMAFFLKCAIGARLNIMVTGGTGSGKTTLLNALSSLIPVNERIITVEDAAEMRFNQPHVISLEARPPNIEGKGEITIRDLVINALRMRPDRLVVGEVRGGEALDMLQAMNTGHDGSLTTAHANSPEEAISRLEAMVLMSGIELPVRSIRSQIGSGLDLILHQSRFPDGSRKISQVSEIYSLKEGQIALKDIFYFEPRGLNKKGEVLGDFVFTGYKPHFLKKFKSRGIPIPR